MALRTNHLLLVAILLTLASAALYLPWQNNPLVFDDIYILKSTDLLDYAQHPFSMLPRQFPYFTLGFEHVVSSGNLHISRYVNIFLHGINGFLLFLLSFRMLQRILSFRRALVTSLFIGFIFIAHPVGVYGAAYLIQRTILFSTLFLLLSALFFDKALLEYSWSRALMAGLLFGLSVLSKEHALTGLISVAGIALLYKPLNWSRRYRVILCFLVAALPFALWVTSIKLGLLATTYEPDVHEIISTVGFPDAGTPRANWINSMALQCLFFFRYIGFWWWPDPSGMSIDIRPDFDALVRFPLIVLGPLCFVALAGGVAFLLATKRTNAKLRLSAYGLLWAASLFLVELSTIRFQEPIVLYRSYLWAPGFLLAITGLISLTPSRLALVLGISGLLAAPVLAWGRLSTFSSELALWEEAALKLPTATVPGAIRIRYNQGVFLARSRQIEKARAKFDWVIQQDPNAFQGYWGRISIRLYEHDWTGAEEDLNTVIRLKPTFGSAYFQLGFVLRQLGKPIESEAAFSRAQAYGLPRVDFK